MKWLSYKLHPIVDAETELPVDDQITRASASDITMERKMIDHLKKSHSEKLGRAQAAMLGKGYDNEKRIIRL